MSKFLQYFELTFTKTVFDKHTIALSQLCMNLCVRNCQLCKMQKELNLRGLKFTVIRNGKQVQLEVLTIRKM